MKILNIIDNKDFLKRQEIKYKNTILNKSLIIFLQIY